MKPVIIIPTYNEIENIKLLLDKVYSVLEGRDFSILVVDDNSLDGTKEFVEEFKKSHNNFYTMHRIGKLGLASAYIEGIKYSIELGFDYFIEMDADFSHDPKYLPYILDNLEKYDCIIGSRNIKGGSVVGWGFLRNFISKGGSLYSRIILGCPIKDLTGGFNAWSKNIIEKINLDKIISKGYSFQIEMKYKAYKNGAKIHEFPITFVDRKYGVSKMSGDIFIEALLNILKIRLRGI